MDKLKITSSNFECYEIITFQLLICVISNILFRLNAYLVLLNAIIRPDFKAE